MTVFAGNSDALSEAALIRVSVRRRRRPQTPVRMVIWCSPPSVDHELKA